MAWPVAWVADLVLGVDVTVLARLRTAEERDAWRRSGWDSRDGVAELYGIVEPPPGLRVIVWDRNRLVRPPEAPGLRLLSIDRRAGESVLTGRALQFRAALVGALLVLVGGGLLIGRRLAMRGRRWGSGPHDPGIREGRGRG